MSVSLVSITPDAEKTIAYCARVSSSNQDNENISSLLKYCVKNGHWSIFEMANMVLEIKTSRAIAQQILRHRSFSFQEFSQRYAVASKNVFHNARRQDSKNRQNSIDDLSEEVREEWNTYQMLHWEQCQALYQWALTHGIAKECARMVLPVSTETKLYMNGTIRSWIHYLDLRTGNGTQLEHMEIANQAKEIFKEQLPIVSKALDW